jgi:hypothetical protein
MSQMNKLVYHDHKPRTKTTVMLHLQHESLNLS